MNKDDMKKLADNPDFIPGIYNYCDRWCERCDFTSRCMNFVLSSEQFGEPEARDIRHKLFWERLADMLRLTRDLLEDAIKQTGIQPESLDLETILKQEQAMRAAAEEHECSQAAQKYAEMTEQWFESAQEAFEEKGEELRLQAQLQISGVNPQEEAEHIQDQLEVIHWYQYQIYVKIMRAIEGKLDEDATLSEGVPKDSEGSAKVALIGIDRSILAWMELRQQFPAHEDDILDILIDLDRLRRKIETVFPAARAFIRPGFDEISD